MSTLQTFNFYSQEEICLAPNDFCFLRKNAKKPNMACYSKMGGKSSFHIWGAL